MNLHKLQVLAWQLQQQLDSGMLDSEEAARIKHRLEETVRPNIAQAAGILAEREAAQKAAPKGMVLDAFAFQEVPPKAPKCPQCLATHPVGQGCPKPELRTCPKCRGKGSRMVRCGRCHGLGHVPDENGSFTAHDFALALRTSR